MWIHQSAEQVWQIVQMIFRMTCVFVFMNNLPNTGCTVAPVRPNQSYVLPVLRAQNTSVLDTRCYGNEAYCCPGPILERNGTEYYYQ